MKKINFLIMLLSLAFLTAISSCSDDDDDGIGTGTIAIAITGLSGIDADITITGGGTTQTITESTTLEALPVGEYTVVANNVGSNGQLFAVDPASSEQTFELEPNQVNTVNFAYEPAGDVVGIVGKWYSAGEDVAPILVNLFMVDSIYAEFRDDQTYVVEQFDVSGTRTTLSGVYTQTASGVGDIYEITVTQSSPAALVSAGIFEITSAAPDAMDYEVAQTEPDIQAIPPTAEGGFGSTNGGIFGTTNVQKYKRLVE